jgi:hypothetical protein
MASIQDIAASKKISDQYVGRMIRLAFLALEGAGGVVGEAAAAGDFN